MILPKPDQPDHVLVALLTLTIVNKFWSKNLINKHFTKYAPMDLNVRSAIVLYIALLLYGAYSAL